MSEPKAGIAIPSKRLRRLATIRSSNVDKVVEVGEAEVKLCNYVDVYYNDRITADIEFSRGSATSQEINKFGLRAGDVIITKDSETPDDIAVPALVEPSAEGVVCGYHLAKLRPMAREAYGPYLFWSLQAKPVREAFSIRAQGITRYGLTLGGIGSVPIPAPDLDTQRNTAGFLDRETSRIDQLIEKKRRLIELILEHQQARLDQFTFSSENAREWPRVPLKWTCRIASGQVDPKEAPWSEMPLIAPNHIERGTGRLLQRETARDQAAESGKYAYVAGTVVYSKIRPGLAKACMTHEDGLCSADMYPITPSRQLLPGFLLMQLLSRSFTAWAVLEAMRVAMPKINREALGAFRLLVPPLSVQKEAVAHWGEERRLGESLVERIRATLDRLREHRIALITAAITGQIAVRGQAVTVGTQPDRACFRVIVGAEIVQRHQGTPKFGRVKLQKALYLAEAHAGIGELQGNYLREAAGPLDRALIAETERGMAAAGFFQASTPDGEAGNAIIYAPLAKAGQHRSELAVLLGPRAVSLKRLVDVLRDLDTRAVEAIATLYAVWNDAIADGEPIDDAAIVKSVLTDWHSEKGKKFKEADLQTWLAWMRRHGLVPRGEGPRTSHTMTRDMFA